MKQGDLLEMLGVPKPKKPRQQRTKLTEEKMWEMIREQWSDFEPMYYAYSGECARPDFLTGKVSRISAKHAAANLGWSEYTFKQCVKLYSPDIDDLIEGAEIGRGYGYDPKSK